jgi:deazaflavin-dependent oxidoreductase (nitroreductase family)
MVLPSPPRGIKAIPWRLPIYLYLAGLGWVMGDRFLLLRHTGRKTGKIRFAVLEIIHSLPEPARYYVVSGFGTSSNWYQNILQQRRVEIQVGKKRLSVHAQQLGPPEGAEILHAYAQKNPGSLKNLSNLMGYEIEFSSEGIREFGRKIPVIQFSTATSVSKE